MKTAKYKITEMFNGHYSGGYGVKIKESPDHTRKITVCNKSLDLGVEFYNMKECTIVNNGNGFDIKTEFNTFTLDFCEAGAMLAGLLVDDINNGGEMVVKRKNKGCTCTK